MWLGRVPYNSSKLACAADLADRKPSSVVLVAVVVVQLEKLECADDTNFSACIHSSYISARFTAKSMTSSGSLAGHVKRHKNQLLFLLPRINDVILKTREHKSQSQKFDGEWKTKPI